MWKSAKGYYAEWCKSRMEERDFTQALISVLKESETKIGYLMGHNEHRWMTQIRTVFLWQGQLLKVII
jgi:hypothetical protein